MLKFDFENISQEPSNMGPHYYYSILLYIQADLKIVTSEGILLNAPYWCIVEFAKRLKEWISGNTHTNFRYESMDDGEPNLFWIKKSENDELWKIGSAWQEFESKEEYIIDEIISSIENYIYQVKKEVKQNLDIDISSVLSSK